VQFCVASRGTSIAEIRPMKTLRSLACVAAALGSLAIAGCTTSSGPDATLRVQNSSDFEIVELHLTNVGSSTWGPNLLGSDSLRPGESITLGVNCGRYDALLVDETDVDCELNDLDLCLNDADWVIRNNTCTVFAAAQAAREAAAKAAASTAPAPSNATL
jgi:hypothetical protein